MKNDGNMRKMDAMFVGGSLNQNDSEQLLRNKKMNIHDLRK